jgi:hypothetical protein
MFFDIDMRAIPYFCLPLCTKRNWRQQEEFFQKIVTDFLCYDISRYGLRVKKKNTKMQLVVADA